jgi:hypothetical protein
MPRRSAKAKTVSSYLEKKGPSQGKRKKSKTTKKAKAVSSYKAKKKPKPRSKRRKGMSDILYGLAKMVAPDDSAVREGEFATMAQVDHPGPPPRPRKKKPSARKSGSRAAPAAARKKPSARKRAYSKRPRR